MGAIVAIITNAVQVYDLIRARWIEAHPGTPSDQLPPTSADVLRNVLALKGNAAGLETMAREARERLEALDA